MHLEANPNLLSGQVAQSSSSSCALSLPPKALAIKQNCASCIHKKKIFSLSLSVYVEKERRLTGSDKKLPLRHQVFRRQAKVTHIEAPAEVRTEIKFPKTTLPRPVRQESHFIRKTKESKMGSFTGMADCGCQRVREIMSGDPESIVQGGIPFLSQHLPGPEHVSVSWNVQQSSLYGNNLHTSSQHLVLCNSWSERWQHSYSPDNCFVLSRCQVWKRTTKEIEITLNDLQKLSVALKLTTTAVEAWIKCHSSSIMKLRIDHWTKVPVFQKINDLQVEK